MSERQLSDNELALLIAESFNALPGPDHRRLLIIEQNLGRPRRHHIGNPWWVALLLLAGAAAAGWGIYQLVLQNHELATGYSDTTPAAAQPTTGDAKVEQQKKSKGGVPNNGGNAGQRGPVIYQR
jgi:hypothetical protein